MTIGRNGALHTSQVKVRYYDTDSSSFVFFTNYQKWLDSIALVEFMDNMGLGLKELAKEGFELTLASITFDYKAPLTVDDVVDVTIDAAEVGNKSMKVAGSVYKHDTGELAASGRAVYVCVDTMTHRPVMIPEPIRKRISGRPD